MLVTIVCSQEFYPQDDIIGLEPTQRQAHVTRFADALPRLIIANGADLGVPAKAPQEHVQVNIDRFHSSAVNACDLHVRIQSEWPYPAGRQDSILEKFRVILYDYLEPREFPVSWRLDLFWSQGHGAYVVRNPEGLRLADYKW